MHDEGASPRRLLGASPAAERSRALAVFYASGGLLNVVSLALPGWPGRDVEVLAGIAVVALATALVLLRAGSRLPLVAVHALVVAGTLLIAAVVVAGGGGAASATYAGYYGWVAVYAAVYFTPRTAVAHGVLAVGAQAAALVVAGDAGVLPAQLALSVGTVLASGIVVGLLTARVRALADTDPLTGLANRRALDSALERSLAQTGRGAGPLAVVSLDLDGFKALNDERGHAAGDAALVQVARAWSAALRPGDLLTRAGGDEFVVVLQDCDRALARDVARRLVGATPSPLSACAGYAVVPPGAALSASRLLSEADRALYAGKAKGQGSVVGAPARWPAPGPRPSPHDAPEPT